MNNMRNTIMMVLVTVLMLSTATFAWFTLSNNAKVTGMSLTAGTASGGLLVGEVPESGKIEYKSILELGMDAIKGQFMPATIPNAESTSEKGLTFYGPKYDDNDKAVISEYVTDNVEKYEITKDVAGEEFSYYEKEFYMKSPGNTGNAEIILLGRAGNTEIKDGDGKEINGDAAKSIRIAFTAIEETEGTSKYIKTVVLEPNADGNVTGTSAKVEFDEKDNYGKYKTISQNTDYSFGGDAKTDNSEILFTIPKGKDVKIIMQVWFEGTDKDCVNEISANQITGKIVFSTTESVVDGSTGA